MSNDNILIADSKDFSTWRMINDTIMGGSSEGICKLTSAGLSLEGTLIEANGGFVSCCSPFFAPPLDFTRFRGIQINIDGQGRTLKIAIACEGDFSRLTQFFSTGIRWVAEIETNKFGTTVTQIPFETFLPTIRAKPVRFPLKFKSSSITQIQLLHSRFGTDGELNQGFNPGPFSILLRSISAYS